VTPEPSVMKLRRSSLSGDAYATVKELLVAGKRYAPGARISVEELSRELGVSRTPIWGAINRLEAEGIVEIVPRQGVYLLDFEPGRAIDVYLAREALEGVAARLAARKATAEQLGHLREALARQSAGLATSDVDEYTAAALAFHRGIAEAAGSRTIAQLLDSVYGRMQAMRVQLKYFPTKLPESFNDHDRILQALEARDAEAAERLARSHIETLRRELERSRSTP